MPEQIHAELSSTNTRAEIAQSVWLTRGVDVPGMWIPFRARDMCLRPNARLDVWPTQCRIQWVQRSPAPVPQC